MRAIPLCQPTIILLNPLLIQLDASQKKREPQFPEAPLFGSLFCDGRCGLVAAATATAGPVHRPRPPWPARSRTAH